MKMALYLQATLDNEEKNRRIWESKTERMPVYTIARLRRIFDKYQPSPRMKDAFLAWVQPHDKDCLVAAVAFFLGDKAKVSGPIRNGHRRGQYTVETNGYQFD
jgi:hypothetical protein